MGPTFTSEQEIIDRLRLTKLSNLTGEIVKLLESKLSSREDLSVDVKVDLEKTNLGEAFNLLRRGAE